MLARPRKRIWPSLICVARSNTRRQLAGLKNGSTPSATSINAKAPSSSSHQPPAATDYFRAGADGAAGALPPAPRMALKKSLPGSTTMTSERLRKLER